MKELIPGVRARQGNHGQDLYGTDVDEVEVRKRIGMVFQKPNSFPSRSTTTRLDPRVLGMKGNMDEMVERESSRAPSGTRARQSQDQDLDVGGRAEPGIATRLAVRPRI